VSPVVLLGYATRGTRNLSCPYQVYQIHQQPSNFNSTLRQNSKSG
jgi:hypothetical protein